MTTTTTTLTVEEVRVAAEFADRPQATEFPVDHLVLCFGTTGLDVHRTHDR